MASPLVAGVAALYLVENGRDLNGDSRVDQNDVFLARSGIINTAFLQSGEKGFGGDPDNFPEPLVNAELLQKDADFDISADSSSVALNPNDEAQSKIIITGRNDFAGTINIVAKTSSDDISASIVPDTVVIDNITQRAESTLIITSKNETGNFSINVNATDLGSGISHTVDVKAQVNSEGGGCLVATAAYGTEMAPQVQFLREIRDNTLFSTTSGASFMTAFNQWYYSFSPTIADWERENPAFKEAVRILITPMISTLSIMTLAEHGSELQVLGLGISVIALNLGIYIVAPTALVLQVRRHYRSQTHHRR
jgi:hypothetical protein